MDNSKVAVLLEDIKSQIRVLGEGMQMLNEKMDSKFAALESANSEEHRLIMQMCFLQVLFPGFCKRSLQRPAREFYA